MMIAAYAAQMAPAAASWSPPHSRPAMRLGAWNAWLTASGRSNWLSRASPMTAKSLWENDPLWQPLRQFVERLLVTYDWGEAFVALIWSSNR